MKRVFLGFSIPPSIKYSLDQYCSSLSYPNIRYVAPDNYHITISFFGEQPGEALNAISQTAKEVFSMTRPLSLVFEKILTAPPKKTPTMIWACYEPSHTFTEMVNNIQIPLRAKIAFDDRRYGQTPIPHITLARFRHIPTKELPMVSLDTLTFTEAHLFESYKHDEKQHYRILETFSFALEKS